jgi:predicted nucleic acid-binding protein
MNNTINDAGLGTDRVPQAHDREGHENPRPAREGLARGQDSCYGDKRAGDPVKYDHLKLVLTDDMTRELLNDDRVLTCGPVIFEINRGLRHSERKGITSLFDALTRLPVEEGAWEQAGDLDASLRRKGITIPPMDILIAQTCRHYDVSLFTLDEHFSSVPGLKLFQT